MLKRRLARGLFEQCRGQSGFAWGATIINILGGLAIFVLARAVANVTY